MAWQGRLTSMLRPSTRHTRQRDSRDSVGAMLNTNAQFIRPFDLGTPPSRNFRQLSIAQNAGSNATLRSLPYYEDLQHALHVKPFIESIVRKVALIRCSLCLTDYAGGTLRKKIEHFWRTPSVRSAAQRITGLPGQPQPDDDVGLFIACLSEVSRHCSAKCP